MPLLKKLQINPNRRVEIVEEDGTFTQGNLYVDLLGNVKFTPIAPEKPDKKP